MPDGMRVYDENGTMIMSEQDAITRVIHTETVATGIEGSYLLPQGQDPNKVLVIIRPVDGVIPWHTYYIDGSTVHWVEGWTLSSGSLTEADYSYITIMAFG